jgi:hypothetical protein
MRRLSITLIIILLAFGCGYSQQYNKMYDFMWLKPQKPSIKTLKKTGKHKLLLLQEFDKEGNCYFIKNDKLNGDVTAIWSIDYDDKGREIKTIFAHSNVGFYIYETVYSKDTVKQYTYTADTLETNENDTIQAVSDYKFNPFNFIRSIESKSELDKLKNILDVYKQKRYLEKLTVLNDQSKPIIEYCFNHKGDTIFCSIHTYTDTLITLKFGCQQDKLIDDLTEYSYRDNSKNVVKSFRISQSENNKPDTSNFKMNVYDSQNKIISLTAIESSKVFSVTTYKYDKDRLILETYSESGRPDELRCFTYKYNEKNELVKEEIVDRSGTHIIPLKIYKTAYEYW